MTATVRHLEIPDPSARTYGTLRRSRIDGVDQWTVEAEPAVLTIARRVFPGADTRRSNRVRFTGTRRQVEDLLWLMLRFPFAMDDETRAALESARADALALAEGRVRRRDRAAKPDATFTGTLRPFQELGCGFLADNPRTILADDMGLGKTVQAIAGLVAVDRWPVVAVVPNNVALQWAKMLDGFLAPRLGGWSHVIRGTRPSAVLPEVPVYVIHYGLVRYWADRLIALGPRVLIFDECQELRRGESQKYSACSRLSDAAEIVWGLSGTPIYNYGEEIWWVTNAIDHRCLGDLGGFSRDWCLGYGNKVVQDPEALGDYLKREGLMLRRTKAEVLPELPKKRRVVHQIDHDRNTFDKLIGRAVELAGRYADIEDRLERGRAAREIENETRRATGIAKAPYVAEFVASLIEAGERPLVYAHHHDVHDAIADRLEKHNPVRISGRETTAAKAAAVESFRDGASSVAVIALRTAAGIDGLQGAGTVVVFAELDWSPAIHAQCEDRLHRIGVDESLESILCYYLVADAGSDETVQAALGLKVGQFVGLMGDTPESEDDRTQAIVQAERHLGALIEKLKRRSGKRGAA